MSSCIGTRVALRAAAIVSGLKETISRGEGSQMRSNEWNQHQLGDLRNARGDYLVRYIRNDETL